MTEAVKNTPSNEFWEWKHGLIQEVLLRTRVIGLNVCMLDPC